MVGMEQPEPNACGHCVRRIVTVYCSLHSGG